MNMTLDIIFLEKTTKEQKAKILKESTDYNLEDLAEYSFLDIKEKQMDELMEQLPQDFWYDDKTPFVKKESCINGIDCTEETHELMNYVYYTSVPIYLTIHHYYACWYLILSHRADNDTFFKLANWIINHFLLEGYLLYDFHLE